MSQPLTLTGPARRFQIGDHSPGLNRDVTELATLRLLSFSAGRLSGWKGCKPPHCKRTKLDLGHLNNDNWLLAIMISINQLQHSTCIQEAVSLGSKSRFHRLQISEELNVS